MTRGNLGLNLPVDDHTTEQCKRSNSTLYDILNYLYPSHIRAPPSSKMSSREIWKGKAASCVVGHGNTGTRPYSPICLYGIETRNGNFAFTSRKIIYDLS